MGETENTSIPQPPMTFLQAIARQEGFYRDGTLPNRLNNPGDMEYHAWMNAFGGEAGDPPDSRFAKFPTPDQGFAALKHLFGFSAYKGKTVVEAIHTFAPSVENDTDAYVNNLCSWIGCKPDDKIDPLVEAS